MGQGWYGAIGKLAVAALLIGAVLIWRAEAWLYVDVPLEHADVIVVLGGESGQRVIGAAELYHRGVAPKVFVTGSGDGGLIARRLGMAGVPDVAYEGQSRSTYENAVLTKGALGTTTAALCMILVMLPFFLFAMYQRNGQPLEVFLGHLIQNKFIRPKTRIYQTNNLYSALVRQYKLEQEVRKIAGKNGKTRKNGKAQA